MIFTLIFTNIFSTIFTLIFSLCYTVYRSMADRLRSPFILSLSVKQHLLYAWFRSFPSFSLLIAPSCLTRHELIQCTLSGHRWVMHIGHHSGVWVLYTCGKGIIAIISYIISYNGEDWVLILHLNAVYTLILAKLANIIINLAKKPINYRILDNFMSKMAKMLIN